MRHSKEIFEWQVVRHLDAGYRLACWLLSNTHDAEDAVQDALEKAYLAFPNFRGEQAKAWFLQIVRNNCMRRLENRKRAPQIMEPEEWDRIPEEPLAAPDAALLANVDTCIVQEEINRLADPLREVILLREFEELSYAEIAEVIGIPIGTVMSRIARARARLMEALSLRFKEVHHGLP